MYCEKCGKQLESGSIFCDGCGARISTADEQTFEQQASSQAPNGDKNEGQQSRPYTAPNYQQNQYSNQGYNQPYYQNYPNNNYQPQKVAPVLSIGQYIGMMIVFAIPIVNIIMLFVWGFGENVNPNKKNFCRAALIMIAIGIVLSFIFSALVVSLLASIFNALGNPIYY
jgi:hypothetical protein